MLRDDIDLTYNPFDDEDDKKNELTVRGRRYFGSAFPSSASTPVLTRRRSSAGESQTSSESTIRRRHRRSRSNLRLDIDDKSNEPSLLSGHPLKSAALRTGDFEDFGITRPHLSRVVQSSSVDSSLFSGSSDTDDSPLRTREPQTEVLVHEVTPSDSLAGVSLKYGIDMTELRRANQLWANDSIHLRETLFIPLHRASKAHEYIIRPSSPGHSSNPPSIYSGNNSEPSSIPSSPTTATPTNVRRVPISQLSYFPPSSNAYRPSGSRSPSATQPLPHTTTYGKQTQPPPRQTTNPGHSLSSLLNALPIAASTRDEIASRLSLDSTSSSYSDRARSRSSSEDAGHEMNNVNTSSGLPIIHSRRQSDSHFDPQQTPKVSRRLNDSSRRETPNGAVSSVSTQPLPGYSRPKLSTSPPSSYVPQAHNPYVRTAQLEPSPGMKVPLVRSSSDGYSPKFLDAKGSQYAERGNGRPIHSASIDLGHELT